MDGPEQFVDAGGYVRALLGPVCDSLIEDGPFVASWPAGGPWQSGIQARAGGEEA